MNVCMVEKFIDRMKELFPDYKLYLNKMTIGDRFPMSYSDGKLEGNIEDLINSCNQISLFRLGEKKVEKSTFTSGVTLDIVRDSNAGIKIAYLNANDAEFRRLDQFKLDKIRDIDIELDKNILTITFTTPSRGTSLWWELPEDGIYGYKCSTEH